jgi:phosphohistidine swiveling domain-containing protein
MAGTLTLEERAAAARYEADAAHLAALAAKEHARDLAEEAVLLEQELDQERWVQLQQEAGYTVAEDGRTVVEAVSGPEYDETPGA